MECLETNILDKKNDIERMEILISDYKSEL
jgi:hypothetical protein